MNEPNVAVQTVPAERPVAQLTPDEAGAEIVAQRGDANNDFNHGERLGHDAAVARVSQLYRRRDGGQEPAPEGSDPLTEDAAAARAAEADKQAWPFERPPVPEGQEWDERAEHALRALTHMHDLPMAEVQAVTHDYRAAWDRRAMDPEARRDVRDAALEQAWGDHVDLKFARAEAMMQELPPRLLQHAQQVGMHYDAPLWLRLAALWERKYQ